MPRTLRWGILGTGNIAEQFVPGLHLSTRNIALAVGSRRNQTAKTFAQAHNVPEAYPSYKGVLEDPRVEAIYVALPNGLHHAWTLAALRAGKHVLCEKPIAANRAEAEEMFDTAQRSGCVLAEAFMYRSHPLMHRVQRRMAEGAIGRLAAIRTSFCFALNRVRGNVRFCAPLAGGALMDIGCYCINFSRFFAGSEPEAVTAVARMHRSGVDIFTAATLRFRGGLIASFACGMDAQADNTATLSGRDGYIAIPMPWKPGHRSEYTVARMAPPRQEGKSRRSTPELKPRQVSCRRGLFTLEADDFARAVFDGHEPVVGRRDALGNMAVLDQIRKLTGVVFPNRRIAVS